MQRLFVLFLDGADFAYVRGLLDRGLLPHIASLTANGAFLPLATATPAESPVAFAEVLTGCNPGKHGLFDFLHRNPATYLPEISLYRKDGDLYRNNLRVPTFCEPLARAGVRTALVRLPSTFPPPDGASLVVSGLGVPDVAGGWGMTQVFQSEACDDDVFGTRSAAYTREGDSFALPVATPGGNVSLRLTGQGDDFTTGSTRCPVGRFSPWLPLAWPGGHGVAAIHIGGGDDPVITLTPIWSSAAEPGLPAVHPADWWRDRAARRPVSPLAGWPEPNLLFARERISFDAFEELCLRCAEDTEQLLFEVLSDTNYDCVVANLELFDRLAHAGFGETASPRVDAALAGAVLRFDAFVGATRAAFPDAEIWIASDHGFAPWTRRVNLNRWLFDNGYLRADPPAREAGLNDLGGDLFWSGVDWSATRAYALGLSKLYLNIEGREGRGIVARGRPERLLKAELIERLSAWTDPDTGGRVFNRVLDASRLYWGAAVDASADIVLCYNPGYRTDWTSSLGGLAAPPLSDNTSNWRADHCGVDPRKIPGILGMPWTPAIPDPSLRDLAPTILRFFGQAVPPEMDGRPMGGDS